MEIEYSVLDNFINCNFDASSFSSSYKSFSLLKKFVCDNDYFISSDMIEILINENEKFRNAIEYIYERYFIQISDNDFTNFDNEILVTSLKKYLTFSKEQLLIIGDESEEVDYDDSDNNYEDGIKIYLCEIGKYPLLTADEEIELANKIKNGDKNAREKFLNSNLRLVVSIAKKYHCDSLTFLDLVQEGSLGLMQALNKFDVSFGYKFSTYATWWINQYILRAIVDKGSIIRIPTHAYEKNLKYKAMYSKLCATLNREPTNEEIAQELNISKKELEDIIKYDYDITSTNTPVNEVQDSELGDFLPSDENIENSIMDSLLYDELMNLIKIAKLDDREKKILLLRNGFINNRAYTLEEIAFMFKLTKERIRQIEINALNKIRKTRKVNDLLIYSQNFEKSKSFIDSINKKNTSNRRKNTNNIDYSYNKQLQHCLLLIYKIYSKDKIKFMLSNLSEFDLNIISLINSNSDISFEQFDYFNKILFYKMKFLLINSNMETIQKKEEKYINDVAIFKNQIEGYYIEKKYNELNEYDCDCIIEYLSSGNLLKFKDMFQFKSVICIMLKYGYFNGKCLSNDSICELLNTSEKLVDKYIYFILERYKDYKEFFKIVDSDEINKIIKL